jgi:hypothetical protein
MVIFTSTAKAVSLKGGYGACLTEELFDQLMTASVENDDRGFQYLLNNGCIVPKAGIQVSVLDTKWTGRTKVRAYVGDDSVVLWTNTENIQR